MTIFRRGGSKELTITVAELEPEKVAQRASESVEPKAGNAAAQHWGLVVTDLTDAQKKELRVRGGVRVQSATDAAQRAGVRAGDVILAVANTEVMSVRDFEALMERVDRSRALNILLRRGDWAQYVLIRPQR